LRLLQKAEEIKPGFIDAPDGPPGIFHWRQCRHVVAHAEGPERIAMEWWANGQNKNETPTRDYFRVETKQGQRFWLYREGAFQRNGMASRWYMQGIFA
jgi:protein ImuB